MTAIVIGVGNRDRGDDAAGPLVCDRLRTRPGAAPALRMFVCEGSILDLALHWDRDDHVVIVELEDYLRGRQPGEVSEIMKQACLRAGMPAQRILFAESPLAGVKLAIAEMQADDLGLFLVLSERDQVIDYVKSH